MTYEVRERLELGIWLVVALIGGASFWAAHYGPLHGTQSAGLASSFGLIGCGFALMQAIGKAWSLYRPSRIFAAPADIDLPPAQRASSLVEWPYEVVTLPGAGLLEALERLRAERPGLLPVALGDDQALDQAKERWDADDRTPAAIIAAAEGQPPLSVDVAERQNDPEPGLQLGTWPAALPSYTETLHPFDALESVHVVLLPVAEPAEAVAYLKFGDFNGAPTPERHVAIHRAWQAAYGARLVACTHETLILQVERGPATPEEAIALAREVYAYADWDLNDYSELAADLMVTRLWTFWWD
ncbi:MAG TPA: DUF4253 domain-containing protein [Caulobacter sp.]|nr:DUF4253 domain-containing protein [Caulobacter sp.]